MRTAHFSLGVTGLIMLAFVIDEAFGFGRSSTQLVGCKEDRSKPCGISHGALNPVRKGGKKL
ncbi:MAG: hypothetical protein DRH11_14330 [Deltaproteobacteria bacterium]|nr:MAG: hypothetical protein DRH11_14330 [Deltaproteobacteria bacterium]